MVYAITLLPGSHALTSSRLSLHDWLWAGFVIFVLFGGAKIPQLARGLGDGIR